MEENKELIEVIIDCYGHKMKSGEDFKIKVSQLPKGNCRKCGNRYFRAWNFTFGIPVICSCIMKYYVEDKEETENLAKELKQLSY